jgi:hypothetical protein
MDIQIISQDQNGSNDAVMEPKVLLNVEVMGSNGSNERYLDGSNGQ